MSYINDEYVRKWSEGNNSQLPHAKNIWGGTFQDVINNDVFFVYDIQIYNDSGFDIPKLFKVYEDGHFEIHEEGQTHLTPGYLYACKKISEVGSTGWTSHKGMLDTLLYIYDYDLKEKKRESFRIGHMREMITPLDYTNNLEEINMLKQALEMMAHQFNFNLFAYQPTMKAQPSLKNKVSLKF